MSNTLEQIAVPASAIKSPKGFLNAVKARLLFGSRLGIGLMLVILGILAFVMVGRRAGLPVDKVEAVVT